MASTRDTITFTVSLPPPSIRRNSETKKHAYRAKLIREYQETVWCAGYEVWSRSVPAQHRSTPERLRWHPWPKAHVHYVWKSIQQTDEDNIIANCKPILDVIKSTGNRPLGIIGDDKHAQVTCEWQKAAHKADECVIVEIEKL